MRRPVYFIILFFFLSNLSAQQLTAVLRNQPGTDNGSREVLQLQGPPGGSLSGLFVLEIEADALSSGQIGTIDNVLDLGSFSPAVFGSNGLLLIQQSNGLPIPPGPATATNRVTVNFPGGQLENGSNTFLLVRDFSGALGDDLDADNDGVLDHTPWTSLLNGVAMNEAGSHPGYGGVPIVKFVGCGVSPPPSPMFAFLEPGGEWVAAMVSDGPDGSLVFDSAPIRSESCVDLSHLYGGETILLGGQSFLPVQWGDFTAMVVDGKVRLQWETVQERHNAFFTVERSQNGHHFAAIARFSAGRRPETSQRYQYVDEAASPTELFYRIRQTDHDGRSTHTPLRRVRLTVNKPADVFVYPNPVGDVAWFHPPAPGVWTLHDARGRRLQTIHANGEAVRINTASFPKGGYWLKGDRGKTIRFVKQ